jgi:hypothetical protein
MSRSGDFCAGDRRQTTDRQTDCLTPAARARTRDKYVTAVANTTDDESWSTL